MWLELDEELELAAVADGKADVIEDDILDDNGKELVGIIEVEKMEVEVGTIEDDTTTLELEGKATEEVGGCAVVVGAAVVVVVVCCCVVVVVWAAVVVVVVAEAEEVVDFSDDVVEVLASPEFAAASSPKRSLKPAASMDCNNIALLTTDNARTEGMNDMLSEFNKVK